MFRKLSIVADDTVTVRDLLKLHEDGHCVYRTSHAGNWNSYKLLLSELGLPDCIWDVTCIYRDVNNQPRYQLLGGKKNHLLGESDPGAPESTVKYLTPYYRIDNDKGTTLSNFHFKPLKELFGNVVSTQSEILLNYRKNLEMVFDVVQIYRPEWLSRYIFPCGCMVDMRKTLTGFKGRCKHNSVEISPNDLRDSAMSTLEELSRLVIDPLGYEPKGGVIYSFELVVASYYLWAYWHFGDKTVWSLSGPDMIGYATKLDFINRVEQVLKLVGQHLPEISPEKVDAKIVPATFFRFGYPKDCSTSKNVMASHDVVLKIQDIKKRYKYSKEISESMDLALRGILPVIQNTGKSWDLFHNPSRDAFYSQHDMLSSGNRMEVLNGFLDVPFGVMGEILRTLPQIESALSRKFSRNPIV